MHWWPNLVIWAITTPVAIWEVIRKLEIFRFGILEYIVLRIKYIVSYTGGHLACPQDSPQNLQRNFLPWSHDALPLGYVDAAVAAEIILTDYENLNKTYQRQVQQEQWKASFSKISQVFNLDNAAELNLLLLLFIQQIEILEISWRAGGRQKLFKLKLRLGLDFRWSFKMSQKESSHSAKNCCLAKELTIEVSTIDQKN